MQVVACHSNLLIRSRNAFAGRETESNNTQAQALHNTDVAEKPSILCLESVLFS